MRSSPNTVRVRRFAALVAVSLLGLPLLGTGAQAAPTEACDPTPKVASSFCVTFDATIGPTLNARDPFDYDISFSNTSASHQTDQDKWLGTITLHLAESNASAPGIIPSAQLPNTLVIAGNDDDCTTPTFANCDAGHGVFVVNVSETGLPFVDGDHTGTFGVRRIVNVANAPAGALKYRVDIEVCGAIALIGDCAIHQSYSEVVQSPIPAGSGGALVISLPVYQEGDQTEGSVTGHYKGTLDSGELHLKGTATKLENGNGAPGGPFNVFKLPARCGQVTAGAEFSSAETPTRRTVDVEVPGAVFGGCPTAAFASTLHGSKVTFDASGSSAHVAGRIVKTWRWVFGDGTQLTRALPTAAHTYPLSPNRATEYTVRLVVLDSKGAISLPETAMIQGTATKIGAPVKSPTQLKVPGTVAPFLAGQHVKVTLQRKQGATFHTFGTKMPALNGASQYTAIFSPRPPAGMCRAIARYPGDATHLASTVTKAFSC